MMLVFFNELCVIYKILYIYNGLYIFIGEGKLLCCFGGSEA